MGNLLTIDCGTQSLRALLFSPEGELLDKVQIEYEPYYSKHPGWAEQDPELYRQSMYRACQHLQRNDPRRFAEIAGVGVTTQRASMVNVDAEGNPLRPVIIWLDQRKAVPEFRPIPPIRLALKLIGLEEALNKSQSDGKCNWIRQREPDIWKKTHKYLQISGFLNHALTGRFADSVASQIGHIPFNYKKMRWCGPRELNRRLFPVEAEKLPELIQPGQILGRVTAAAAEATGIREGTPVIACGSDKGCETIGMGVMNPRMVSLSFGTTATVQTTTNKYMEALRFMPPYPSPVPGHYNPEVEIFRGFWMITWFKNEFAHQEVREAAETGVPPEAVMERLLEASPPGAMGLMVQPFWSPGLKHPSAKGAMIGFGDVHKKAHVYRAVIEGLGYAMLDGMRQIEKTGGVPVERAAVSGGASQSDAICQIAADIFNLPLVRGRTFETSGLGAAIVTAVGAGVHPSFEEAIRRMVHYEKTFKPDERNANLYRRLYEQVYRKMYPALKPFYEEIREITGYPEK